jgi:hypothetical protein
MSRAKNKRANKRKASRSVKVSHKGRTQDGVSAYDKALLIWGEYIEQERSAWLSRPRLHTAIFEEALKADELEKFLATTKAVLKQPEVFERQKQKRREEIAAQIGRLGWSAERLDLFMQRVAAYRKEPSIQNYLLVRREFPDVEIQVGQFGGIDALFTFEEYLKGQGIDPHLVAAALDADEPGVDALCLRLLELLSARHRLPKGGPGHIEKRRSAISDATVNYLIIMILEAYDWHSYTSRVPASLVALARHQLCASIPDLVMEFRSREHRRSTALAVAQRLKPGEKLSINKLKKLADLPRTTAARWLADAEFQRWLDNGRKWAAEGVFEEGKRAAI